MQITNSVIQLAKERAQFGFAALAQQMLQDADERIVQLQVEVRSGSEQYALVAGRQFIQSSGKIFVKRVDTLYREMLDRAMRTMYTDLRVSIQHISAANLTLIDDETVTHQIEIDRLVLRLRDADDENLRRLNILIGQLHNDHDAKERENPFRPYLMAHTLHQTLHELVVDEDTKKRLFSLLSDSLAKRLADFYASIREVFEKNGLHAELMAQKPRQARKQRDLDGNTVLPSGVDFDARVLPGLQRMLDMMSQMQLPAAPASSGNSSAPSFAPAVPQIPQNPAFPSIHAISAGPAAGFADSAASGSIPFGSTGPGNQGASQEFQNFVQGIFKLAEALPALSVPGVQSVPGQSGQSGQPVATPPAESTLQAGSEALVARLNQYQQQAALGHSVDDQIAPEQNQLFALGEQLGPDQVTKLERVAIDVVAMLFELILNDEQIPEGLRRQIGRLQIPFLKAAMLTPDMLQQTRHPARQLVNRLGSAAVALDLSSPVGQSVEKEITRIVTRILAEFDDDISIFTDSLFELERFLTDNLRHTNTETELGVEALEDVEHKAVQETKKKKPRKTKVVPPDWLADFTTDPRVVEFIVNIWMRVIEQEVVESDGNPGSRVYRKLLPDLVWSVQDKQSAAERVALVNLLPALANRLKEGMTLLNLTEKESREALDQLVRVHTQVLRSSSDGGDQSLFNLEEMRAHFSRLSIGPEQALPPPVESEEIETELAKRGVAIDLDLEREPTPSFESDADWLTHMQIGTCVERWSDTGYQMARLTWVSKRQTLFMFQLEKKTAPVVYSAISLIKSLREGSVRLVEHAPVFERAVETLLNGARAVETNREV
jgi:hypothetical protein